MPRTILAHRGLVLMIRIAAAVRVLKGTTGEDRAAFSVDAALFRPTGMPT
jgi:hypothetical protein